VVWLDGESDITTERALCLTLARAIALDSARVVVDLSGVEVVAPSTIEVIARAREFLRHRSRSLTVRSPSACARRVIEECGLQDLLDQATTPRPRPDTCLDLLAGTGPNGTTREKAASGSGQ
jgi:anti-anti-sigma factor